MDAVSIKFEPLTSGIVQIRETFVGLDGKPYYHRRYISPESEIQMPDGKKIKKQADDISNEPDEIREFVQKHWDKLKDNR